ncbi:hypothetical protein [Candidatus Uabimicrobium sp. HlEnr_7]|uniref:hypothetical protein n=1 Tax=Candidatus Uabimicrobium helgolandensis TaxID=3095367 RepID=UPI003555DEDE
MKKLLSCFIIVFLVPAFADTLYTQKSQQAFSALQSLLTQEKHDLHEYHISVKRLTENDPHAIRYVVANSVAILGNKARGYKLPRTTVNNAIFGKNILSGTFVTYSSYIKDNSISVKYSELTPEEFKQLTIFAYAKMPRDFIVQVDNNVYHRDQIIDELERSSDLGKFFLHVEKTFLKAAENNFWEFELESHTDADGNLAVDSFAFAADSKLLATVQLNWRGIHESFTNAQFTVNGQEIHNGEALNYEAYQVVYDVKAKNNTCRVTAEGGPKDALVKVVLADCG